MRQAARSNKWARLTQGVHKAPSRGEGRAQPGLTSGRYIVKEAHP